MSRAGAPIKPIFCVLYRSVAQLEFNASQDLPQLTESAQIYNSQYGITGMLLFSGGFFVQYLEGAEPDVMGLLNKIIADQRHSQLVILAKHPIAKRHYGAWSMESFDLRESESIAQARIDNLTLAHSELTTMGGEPIVDGVQSADEIALQLLAKYMTPPGFH